MPTGTSGWRARKPRSGRSSRRLERRRPARAAPPPGSPARRRPDRRTGIPTSIMSAPPSTTASSSRALVSQVRDRRASGTRRTRPRRSEPLEHRGVAAHASSACAWATSLSPRPDRPTRIDAVRLLLGELQRVRERVRGFERAEDALALGQRLERGERLGVGRADIFGAAAVLQMRMLRARPPDNRGPAETDQVSAIWPSSSCST